MAKIILPAPKARKPKIAETPLTDLAAARSGRELSGVTDQVRELQSRIYDVMNLCNMVLDAAYSDRRREEEDNFEMKGTMRIAARELEAIAGGLDIAATALEGVSHA